MHFTILFFLPNITLLCDDNQIL